MSRDQEPPRPVFQRGRAGLLSFLASIVALLGAVVIALWPVKAVPSTPPALDSARWGYSLSLALFLVPVAILGTWLWRKSDLHLVRGAFWPTVIPWALIGFGLDVSLAARLFEFPSRYAVLDIPCIPILGDGRPHEGACPSAEGAMWAGAPVEEFVFYLSGFLAVLLVYIWADEVWLGSYNKPDYGEPTSGDKKVLRFDGRAIAWGGAMLLAAWAYKARISDEPGFPIYFSFLVLFAVIPAAGLLKASADYVNWRAFSFTFFWIVLISVIWEVTLALPYGYWNYQTEPMIGIRVTAWHDLPVEAVLVWLAVAFSTILTFEAVKIWRASSLSARAAFFGEAPTEE